MIKSLHRQSRTKWSIHKTKCQILRKIRKIRLCKIKTLKIIHPADTLLQRISQEQGLFQWVFLQLQRCSNSQWTMAPQREKGDDRKVQKISIIIRLVAQMERALQIALTNKRRKLGVLRATRTFTKMKTSKRGKKLIMTATNLNSQSKDNQMITILN